MNGQTDKQIDDRLNNLSEDKWRHMVLYRIQPTKFADSDYDGEGDIHGIIDQLDYVAGLGVDAVQITGVYDPINDAHPADDASADLCELGDFLCQLKQALAARNLMIVPDFNPNLVNSLTSQFTDCKKPRQLKQLINKIIETKPSVCMTDSGEARFITSYGKSRDSDLISRMMAVVINTLPASPCIFQGQELGMVGDYSIRWGMGDFNESRERSVLRQDDDPKSVLNCYRKAIAMRKSSLILQEGEAQMGSDRDDVASYIRCLGDEAILVVANLGNRAVKPKAPLVGRLMMSSYADRTNLDGGLLPYEAVVFRV